MKRKQTKKLTFNTETLRRLEQRDLESVAAGRDPQYSVERPCKTTLGPHSRCW